MEIRTVRRPTAEELLLQMRCDSLFEYSCDREAEGAAAMAVAEAGKISAPKKPCGVQTVYLCGKCVYNCAYCALRAGGNQEGYLLSPRQAANLAYFSAKQSGRGIFLSSAIEKSPDDTQQKIAETSRILREELGYTGYLHAKVMPGADPRLIEQTGCYANRLSVNIEVAQSCGYAQIAKQKNKTSILRPMADISAGIRTYRSSRSSFASSHVTQLMAGSTGEDDRTILNLSQALYRKFQLRRVYYSSFFYPVPAKGYSVPPVQTPAWRAMRLFQADSLLRLYGFSPEEILPASSPFLSAGTEPKTVYALRNPWLYPVEISTADFDTLIRVPGIGVTSAKKILIARKSSRLSPDLLSKMRISPRKSLPFLTFGGKYYGRGFVFPDLSSAPPEEELQLPLFRADAL